MTVPRSELATPAPLCSAVSSRHGQPFRYKNFRSPLLCVSVWVLVLWWWWWWWEGAVVVVGGGGGWAVGGGRPIFKRREDLGKHSVHTHFPKDRNCEICKRTKITRAPCRRRNGEVVLRAVNFGDLITADHKIPGDNCESRNNHRHAVVVQDSATQWIQAYPCKHKISQETQRKFAKVFGIREETKSHLHWQFLGIRRSLWRSLLESLHVHTTSISNKWDCWEKSAKSKGKHLCRVVAIRSKWKLVGRFHGMLHLSAKRHRFMIWWEDALWKTFWATILRTYYSIWFTGVPRMRFVSFHLFLPSFVDIWVLIKFSKTHYRIRKDVDLCALKIDNSFIINRWQIFPWMFFPSNRFQIWDIIFFCH